MKLSVNLFIFGIFYMSIFFKYGHDGTRDCRSGHVQVFGMCGNG